MNKTDKILLSLYVGALTLAAFIFLYFETVGGDHVGCLYDEKEPAMRVIFEYICIAAGLVSIYGGMKLMVIKKVKQKITEESEYRKYALIRWGMVCGSMLLCELTYYLFLSTNVVAFVAICAIAVLYVWPSASRRQMEMGPQKTSNDV